MHIGNYLALAASSEQQLAEAFDKVIAQHGDEPDVLRTCGLLASWSREHRQTLQKFVDRYADQKGDEPERLSQTLFVEARTGSLALLRDLHDLWLLASEVQLCWTIISQAAAALMDKELAQTCHDLSAETKRQLTWLLTRIKSEAPQTLVAAD